MKNDFPDWVLKHKRKNTQIIKKGNSFYLYQITSKWDPQKARAKKITEKYLGKITKDGLIKPKHERILDSMKAITVKEFGATSYVLSIAQDIEELLKVYFPDFFKSLLVFSLLRLFHSSAIKNVIHHFRASYLSEVYPDASLSAKSLSQIIREVGRQRQKVVEFLRHFLKDRQYQVIDITQVFSYSDNVISATLGYNGHGEYVPQVNFLLVFSLKEEEPGFFRILTGNIRDVSAFKRTLQEAAIEDAVIICDKGFYSENNIKFLEQENLKFIMPLRRNSSLIDYSVVGSGRRREFDGYFIFEKRVIWWKEKRLDGKKVILYFDPRLKAEEEKDIIGHIQDGRIEEERFYEIEHRLGSIEVLTNTDYDSREVFELLKGRAQIEQAFDTFKNFLNADRTYLRDDESLNGWMFVNFVSLMMYYRIYNELRKAKLLSRYSVKDVLIHLGRIYKLKMPHGWEISEIPKQARLIAEKLKLDLHIT